VKFTTIAALGVLASLPVASIVSLLMFLRPYTLTMLLIYGDATLPTMEQKLVSILLVSAVLALLGIAMSFFYVMLLHHYRGRHLLLGMVCTGTAVSTVLLIMDVPKAMEWAILILLTDFGLGLMIPMLIKEYSIEYLLR